MDLMSNIALKIMWVGCKGEIKDKSTQQEHPSKELWKRLLKVFSSAIHKAEISHCVRGQMRKQLKALRKNIIGLSTCLWTFFLKWKRKMKYKNIPEKCMTETIGYVSPWTLVKMPFCLWQQVEKKIRNCNYFKNFISVFLGRTGNSIILESLWTAPVYSQYIQSHHCDLPWGYLLSSFLVYACLH